MTFDLFEKELVSEYKNIILGYTKTKNQLVIRKSVLEEVITELVPYTKNKELEILKQMSNQALFISDLHFKVKTRQAINYLSTLGSYALATTSFECGFSPALTILFVGGSIIGGKNIYLNASKLSKLRKIKMYTDNRDVLKNSVITPNNVTTYELEQIQNNVKALKLGNSK